MLDEQLSIWHTRPSLLMVRNAIP